MYSTNEERERRRKAEENSSAEENSFPPQHQHNMETTSIPTIVEWSQLEPGDIVYIAMKPSSSSDVAAYVGRVVTARSSEQIILTEFVIHFFYGTANAVVGPLTCFCEEQYILKKEVRHCVLVCRPMPPESIPYKEPEPALAPLNHTMEARIADRLVMRFEVDEYSNFEPMAGKLVKEMMDWSKGLKLNLQFSSK
jgi:hypothetical protein